METANTQETGEDYVPNGMLERISLNGMNSKNSLVKKVAYPFVFYIGGSLFGPGHGASARWLGMTESELTIRHSKYIGFVGMTIEAIGLYLYGQEAKDGMPGKISDIFNVGYNTALFLYWSGLGIVQNANRIRVTRKTGEGVGTIGFLSAISNGVYYAIDVSKKGCKRLRKFYNNHFSSGSSRP
jgi:hypothetical protein